MTPLSCSISSGLLAECEWAELGSALAGRKALIWCHYHLHLLVSEVVRPEHLAPQPESDAKAVSDEELVMGRLSTGHCLQARLG